MSGITQVLLCTTSPSRLRRATSPSRGGFGIPSRFPAKPNQFHRKRDLFAKGSHFGGAGASAPERASPVKLLQRRCDTMALTSRVRIAVCLALWQHPCPLRLLRRHLSQSERLWHSVTFSSKTKSVSSKTKPLCQGLPCQERLPRPGESFLVGEALAFRHVFQQAPISFIENETSLPRALLPGELSSGCETERF